MGTMVAIERGAAPCPSGVGACCARTAIGQAAAAPPRTVMNWRRVISGLAVDAAQVDDGKGIGVRRVRWDGPATRWSKYWKA